MFTIITSGYKEASVVICYTGKLGKKRDSYEYLEAGQVGGDQKEDAKTSLPTLSPEETPDAQFFWIFRKDRVSFVETSKSICTIMSPLHHTSFNVTAPRLPVP